MVFLQNGEIVYLKDCWCAILNKMPVVKEETNEEENYF